MQVWDVVLRCTDGPRKRPPHSVVRFLVIHRIGESVGGDAVSIAASFRDNSKDNGPGSYTGYRMPYHFIVKPDGSVEQAVPLEDVAPHVKLYNNESIGIGIIGDFRAKPPTDEQVWSAAELCAMLREWYPGVRITGHTELGAKATSDPEKQCPGNQFPLAHMKLLTTQIARGKRERMLRYAGISLTRPT